MVPTRGAFTGSLPAPEAIAAFARGLRRSLSAAHVVEDPSGFAEAVAGADLVVGEGLSDELETTAERIAADRLLDRGERTRPT